MFVFVMIFSVLFLFGVGMFLNFFRDEDYLSLIFGILISWFAGYAIFYNLNHYYSNFDSVSHSKVIHWESCLELGKSDCCVNIDWKRYCLDSEN